MAATTMPFQTPKPKLPPVPAITIPASVMSKIDLSEYGKVALWTLVPGAGGVACMVAFFNDKEAVNWWRAQKKPVWAPKDDRVYMAMDFITSSPLGCASYLVYKHGSGLDYSDTRVALGAYAAMLVVSFASFPIFVKKRNPKLNTALALAIFGSSGVTTALFYKIHPHAGYMLVPYTLWTGFYAALMASIWRSSQKPFDDL